MPGRSLTEHAQGRAQVLCASLVCSGCTLSCIEFRHCVRIRHTCVLHVQYACACVCACVCVCPADALSIPRHHNEMLVAVCCREFGQLLDLSDKREP
eukprot:1160635-Pelagomonas_calceolata.AAC.2